MRQELVTPTRARKLTSRELAHHLSVSQKTLSLWRSQGRIPYVRVTARTLRYDLAEVEAALRK